MSVSETLAEVYKQHEIGEFMTTSRDFPRRGLEAWSDRKKAGLMASGKSSHYIPRFRPFDLLADPNSSVVVLENDFHRLGVESVCGAQDAFHRYVDCDMIYFQYCGRTTVETEFGVFEMRPGDLLLVPGGISHRSTGTADSLRYFCLTHEPIDHVMGADQYTSETEFDVRRVGGPSWAIPTGREKGSTGRVQERMHCWDDGPPDFTIVERDYGDLVGVSKPRGSLNGPQLRRAFDHFTGIVGKGNDEATQYIFECDTLRIRTYNIRGEQHAFHRALRTEEARIQFRGNAVDLSELENVEVVPGDVTVIPLGIAHSVMTDPPQDDSFLRLNFYSSVRWRVPVDLTNHVYESHFETSTRVLKEADWKLTPAGAH
jgi:mannose-6-phosphate isomerase-like protein (cupin superfamily)